MSAQRPLLRLALRHGRKHLASTLLLIFGIALGVSVVISVDLAGQSVSRSFSLTTEALYGKATHQLTGSGPLISPGHYRWLRVDLGLFKSTPVIDVTARIKKSDKSVRLLGMDPVSAEAFRTGPELSQGISSPCFPKGDEIIISRLLANTLDVEAGDGITLTSGGRAFEATVVCVSSQGVLSASELVVADIAFASKLAGTSGHISRVDLILTPDEVSLLSASLPEGLFLKELSESQSTRRSLSRAFEVNLTAFSTLALFMGMFLIYSTVSFSVSQRLKQIAILKAVGASPKDLFHMVMGETALYALLGSLLGVVLGALLGKVTVALVASTISELYYDLLTKDSHLSLGACFRGILFGGMAAFAASVPAARTASREAPITTIVRRGAKGLSPLALAGIGVGLSMVAFGVWGLSSASLPLAFAGLFCLLSGAAIMVPLGLQVLKGILPRFATSLAFDLRSSIRRTVGEGRGNALTVATLMVVMAATLGVGLMTGSFRVAVKEWIGRNIPGDIQLSTGVGSGRLLPERFISEVAKIPGIQSVVPYSVRTVDTWMGETILFSYDGVSPEQAWVWREEGEGVYVSEVFARRTKAGKGSLVMMKTALGERAVKVKGVFSDFFTGAGRVIMTRPLYEALWRDRGHTDLQLFVEKGFDEERVADAVATISSPYGLVVNRGRLIREETLVVFDRTFRIAGALQLLIALTAVVGVFSAFTSRVAGRFHETGVLRAVGAEPRLVKRLFVAEFLLLASYAAFFALPLGVTLALYLIDVINARSFGWRYDLILVPSQLFFCILLPLAAALPAGLIPAHKAAHSDVLEALRAE